MSDNELLLAMSDMMDAKLKPIDERTKRLEITLENEILPRLQNIEACYTTTSNRYLDATERIDATIADVELLKKVVAEHSEKLKKIS